MPDTPSQDDDIKASLHIDYLIRGGMARAGQSRISPTFVDQEDFSHRS